MVKKNRGLDNSVGQVKNIGPKTAEKLAMVGITTVDDLHEVGAIEAYCRLRRLNPAFISLVGLYAMQAGLMGIDWRDLPGQIKTDLKEKLRLACLGPSL